MKPKHLLVCILVAFTFLATAQTEIHVDPTAKAGGKGTLKRPYSSLQDAVDAIPKLVQDMKSDLVVYLHDGVYQLTQPIVLNEKHSGTNGHQVIFRAYEKGRPIISGGEKVSGWEKVAQNIYKTTLERESKLRSLFVNGQRMKMAQTDIPVDGLGNWGTFKISGKEDWAFGAGSGIDGIKFASSAVAEYKNPDDIELVQFNIWTEKILGVREIEALGDTTVFKLQQPYGAIATSMAWAGKINYKKSFVIRNAYELLDSPGEFYFDKSTKALYVFNEEGNLSDAEVIVPTSAGLLQIAGSSTTSRAANISIEGITFSHDDWQLMEVAGSKGFAGIQSLGLAVKYIPGGNWHPTEYNSTDVPRGAIQVSNAENISFIRNKFERLSSAIAINLVNDVRNSEVNGNFFNDLLGNAVNIGHPQHYKIGDGELFGPGVEGLCEGNMVSNNYLRNVSLDFRQVEGITSFFVANTNIEHNDIAWTPYGAITCGWWWGNSGISPSTVAKNNNIRYNKAGNTHQVLDDGGIIYVLGEQPGSVIAENYVFNGPRCIYPDDGSAYWTITKNVVGNNSYKWMWLHFWTKRCHDVVARENYVKNNLLMNNGTNCVVEETHAFREDDFPEKAQKIIDNAGIEAEFSDIIPEKEPKRINIHPEGFKERDVFH